jgi:hypothetical protein
MSTNEIDSKTFRDATLRSERTRIVVRLAVLAVLAVLTVSRMVVFRSNEAGRILALTFAFFGSASLSELLMLHRANQAIRAFGENFEGWEEKGDWADLSFMMKYDPEIERIAIVGEKKWEDLVIAFTGKGMRSGQVEYFLPDQINLARAWITS